jgi:hypothetical protein
MISYCRYRYLCGVVCAHVDELPYLCFSYFMLLKKSILLIVSLFYLFFYELFRLNKGTRSSNRSTSVHVDKMLRLCPGLGTIEEAGRAKHMLMLPFVNVNIIGEQDKYFSIYFV